MNGIKGFVRDTIISYLNSFDGNVKSAVGILTDDIFTGSLYEIVAEISKIIKPVAYTIITICFLLEFLKMVSRMDILKWEFAFRIIIKFVIAKAAIEMSSDFMIAIYTTGKDLIIGAGSVSSGLGEVVGKSIETILDKMGWVEAIGLLATSFVAFLAVMVAGIIVMVIAYARSIEILIYVAVTPLPVAFLPMEDNNGITKHFFMSFAGVVLQGLFIIIAVQLFNGIVASSIGKAIEAASGWDALGVITVNNALY